MNYLLANTVSGRILSLVEYNGDDGQILQVSNSDLILYYQANCAPNVIFKKYWSDDSATIVDKTQMTLTYSHPHVEKDFFSEINLAGPRPTRRVPVENWDNDEVDLMAQHLLLNDFDEIKVAANTTITISNIPTDLDTVILVNGVRVDASSSIDINSYVNTVTIDSPRYFIKTIQIVEER